MPGLSDGRQPCSDYDAVAKTGCEPGISDCNFAGTFTITDSAGNMTTYNIILDVGGSVLNAGMRRPAGVREPGGRERQHDRDRYDKLQQLHHRGALTLSGAD